MRDILTGAGSQSVLVLKVIRGLSFGILTETRINMTGVLSNMADHPFRRWLFPAVAIAAILTIAVPLWMAAVTGGGTGGGMHGGYMMGSHMGSTSGGVWSGPALFVWTVSALVLVVAGSALALSYASTDSTISRDKQNEGLDTIATLRERYVGGELSEPEFEQRVERLLESRGDETSSERVRDIETESR